VNAERTREPPVVVVGLGGIGAAALYHLARRGVPVLGLEGVGVPHERGSSHGHSRILRLAYFEDPAYVPMARAALELWRGLERESGERLFMRTGGIDGGAPDGSIFRGSLAACREHGLEHEVVDGTTLRARYGALRVPRGDRFVLQPDAGILFVERCTEAHVRMGEALGAEVRAGVRVDDWRIEGGRVRVALADGDEIVARHLVLTPGPWAAPALAPAAAHGVELPDLRVERQVVAWFAPEEPGPFGARKLPVFNLEVGGGHHYGFPGVEGRGPKLGRFGHLHEDVDAETVSRRVTCADVELLQGWADHHFVRAGAVVETSVCLFTHTPDRHFVVDTLPELPVTVGCGFSGHGFKFAPAIGQAIAARVLGETPPVPMAHLRWGRPGLTAPPPGSR
jgi:sarcosine oxidase